MELAKKILPENPLAAYEYDLPARLIAQNPAKRRVQAKLMGIKKHNKSIIDGHIYNLLDWLQKNDLLILNNTKVLPARMQARKSTGGKVEIFLLSPTQPFSQNPETHRVLLRGAGKVKELILGADLKIKILENYDNGRALVELPEPAEYLMEKYGQAPLPPYIKRPFGLQPDDACRYQTVYAQRPGAVAAPTAGLHLSKELIAALIKKGIKISYLTLHVSYATFAEPSLDDLLNNRLHEEWVELDENLCQAVAECQKAKGRVIAVGTTSLRALEWAGSKKAELAPYQGWCDLLIKPGFNFKLADGLMTNFHLPRTSLLMLVSAFAGEDLLKQAYKKAIEQSYRFYSYGDAMLVL